MNKKNKFEKYVNGLVRCRICGRFAIIEEIKIHECRSLKSYKIKDNVFRAFDGHFWYPLKWDQVCPTKFDRENFRRRLYRTLKQVLSTC